MNQEIKTLLLSAPDGQLDKTMRPLIAKWDDPPKAIQILEVLDYCVHGALANSFVIMLFESLLDEAMRAEGIVLETLVEQASWRKQ